MEAGPKRPTQNPPETIDVKLDFSIENGNLDKLKEDLRRQPILEGKDNNLVESRRAALIDLSSHLGEISKLLIVNLLDLARGHKILLKDICVYLVGGRVRNEPIKDNSDFDLVIAVDSQLLNPLSRDENAISFSDRQKIVRALNQVVGDFLLKNGFGDNEEVGLLELKDVGMNSPEDMDTSALQNTESGGLEAMKICRARLINR